MKEQILTVGKVQGQSHVSHVVLDEDQLSQSQISQLLEAQAGAPNWKIVSSVVCLKHTRAYLALIAPIPPRDIALALPR